MIYLDVTETYWSGFATGIQRVVRNLASRSMLIADSSGHQCRPVICGFHSVLDASNLIGVSTWPRSGFDSQIGSTVPWFRRQIERWFPPRSFTFRAIHKVWRALRLPLIIREYVDKIRWEHAQSAVSMQPGDVLVLSDAFWTHCGRRAVKMAERAAVEGVIVVVIIYDVIALTHSEVADDGNAASFKQYLTRVLAIASGIITIAATTAVEIENCLEQLYPKKQKVPVKYFHLGYDLVAVKSASRSAPVVRSSIANLSVRRFYLTVGTVEPRKGHEHILAAFERRWASGDPLILCIVGKIGWKCEHVVAKIEQHPELGNRLFFFTDSSDEELASLYRSCQALIFASIAEGFGLPLVEAMGAGAPIIANDIPVFREIGGNYPIYFSLGAEGLNSAITEMERRIASSWRPKPRPWISWDQAAEQFAHALTMVANEKGLTLR